MKSYIFEKINQVDRPVAGLHKNVRKKTLKSEFKRGDITTDRKEARLTFRIIHVLGSTIFLSVVRLSLEWC